jgi:hypothetical protein
MPFGAGRIHRQFTASQVRVGDAIDQVDGKHEAVSVERVPDSSFPGSQRVVIKTDKGAELDLDPSHWLSSTEST